MALLTPEYLQTKTYSALRDRLVLLHSGVQAGVWDAADFKATQRSAGANMSVDVGAGFALVAANDPGNAGLYHVQNDATVNVASFAASNGSLPRLDSVILRVNDTTHGGDASDTPTLEVVAGTATAGATLDNRTGAGAIPTGALLLADVLIPAASSTIVTANIRDRRAWARGAKVAQSTASAVTLPTGLTNSFAGVTDVFASRIEISVGNALRAEVYGKMQTTPVGGDFRGRFMVNGAYVRSDDFITQGHPTAANSYTDVNFFDEYAVTSGSSIHAATFYAPSGGSIRGDGGRPFIVFMTEIVAAAYRFNT